MATNTVTPAGGASRRRCRRAIATGRAALAASLALAATACRTPAAEPSRVHVEPPQVPPGQSFAASPLLETRELSAAAATVRGTLPPHLHRRHSETVYVLRGSARMLLGDSWLELVPGDLVHVPAGTPHAVVSAEGASVLSIFAPPFDGEDRVWLE